MKTIVTAMLLAALGLMMTSDLTAAPIVKKLVTPMLIVPEPEPMPEPMPMPAPQSPPRLGVQGFAKQGGGFQITSILDGYPAQDAQLEPRDVILQMNNKIVRTNNDVNLFLDEAQQNGGTLTMLVLNHRDQAYYEISAEIVSVKLFNATANANGQQQPKKLQLKNVKVKKAK